MAFMDLKKIKEYENISFSFNNKTYLVKLCSYNTANGFNHKAEIYEVLKRDIFNDIFIDEIYMAKKIINYINRTWERFTFESVILGLLSKVFKKDYLIAFNLLLDSNNLTAYKKDLEEGSV